MKEELKSDTTGKNFSLDRNLSFGRNLRHNYCLQIFRNFMAILNRKCFIFCFLLVFENSSNYQICSIR